MKKLFIITTNGENSEDFNMHYSTFVVVEGNHPFLNFEEKLFKVGADGYAHTYDDDDNWVEAVQALGYTTEVMDPEFVIQDESDEEYDDE